MFNPESPFKTLIHDQLAPYTPDRARIMAEDLLNAIFINPDGIFLASEAFGTLVMTTQAAIALEARLGDLDKANKAIAANTLLYEKAKMEILYRMLITRGSYYPQDLKKKLDEALGR